ncbi:MAG TPA: hypothetical protein VLT33_34180, partial [Labilithrix sp.]|nr:hypothetical protein [Labilithrix sp.]
MLARHRLLLAPLTFLGALSFSLIPLGTNGCSGSGLVAGGEGGTGAPIEGGSSGEGGGGGEGGIGGGACSPPNVGGTNKSEVAVQAINDYAASAAADRDALLASCKALAKALDATPADQTAADAMSDPRARTGAWCNLAVKGIAITKSAVGGTLRVDFRPPTCEDSVPEKGT